MTFKCNDCGAIFDEDEIARWKEYRGEFWGQQCYEWMSGCPKCFSDDFDEYVEDEEDAEDDDSEDEKKIIQKKKKEEDHDDADS